MLSQPFLWGGVGLLQTSFLPGYLLLRSFRLRVGVIETLLWSFVLSGIFNFALLWLLGALVLPHHLILLVLIPLEAIAVVALWSRKRETDALHVSLEDCSKLATDWKQLERPERLVFALCLALSVSAVVLTIVYAFDGLLDSGFVWWDSFANWNRWATEWAALGRPIRTFSYPQFLPANASIFYTLMGDTEVQIFNRIYYWAFPVGIQLMLLNLGLRCRHVGYWAAAALVYALMSQMAPPGPGDGMADAPLAFMMLMTCYALLLADAERSGLSAPSAHDLRSRIILGGIAAGAAGLCKQPGMMVVAVFPLLAWMVSLRGTGFSVGRRLKWIGFAMLVPILIAVTWYVIKIVQIRYGKDASNTQDVLHDAHAGRGLLARVQFAGEAVVQHVMPGNPRTVYWIIATLFVLSVIGVVALRPWRWIALLVFLPNFVVWLLITSYDLRNAVPSYLILGIMAGLGCGAVLRYIGRQIAALPPPLRRPVTVALVIAVWVGVSAYPLLATETLHKRQAHAQMKAGLPALNDVIYTLQTQNRLGVVVTNYYIMRMLPGMKDHMIYDAFDNPERLRKLIREKNPTYIAVTHPRLNYGAINDVINKQQLLSGRWQLVAAGLDYFVAMIRDPDLPPADEKPPAPFSGFDLVRGLTPTTDGALVSAAPADAAGAAEGTSAERRLGVSPLTEVVFYMLRPEAVYFKAEYVNVKGGPIDAEVSVNGVPYCWLKFDDAAASKTVDFRLGCLEMGTNRLVIRHYSAPSGSGGPRGVVFSKFSIVAPNP